MSEPLNNPALDRLIARLPPALRAEPKKSAILAGLTLLATVVALRQFVFTGRPAGASAAPVAAKASALVDTSTRTSPRPASSSAAAPVAAWLAQPIKALDRNLFEFKAEFFPRTTHLPRTTVRVVEEELFWDQLAKSLAVRADSRKQRQIRVENLILAAGKLRVQSTIMGATPRALVDGRMIRLGATLEAGGEAGGAGVQFKVIRIDARRIVIERDEIQIEVPMGAGKARVLSEGN